MLQKQLLEMASINSGRDLLTLEMARDHYGPAWKNILLILADGSFDYPNSIL